MTEYHGGIESHKAIVEPSKLDIFSNREIAYMEPGFTLDLPENKRKQVERTFFRVCGVTKKEKRRIKSILRKSAELDKGENE